MKKRLLAVGVLILAALLVSTPLCGNDTAAQNNLARNASVEEGAGNAPALWRFWNWAPEGEPRTSHGEWDRTVARTGNASLKIVNESEKDVGAWTNRQGEGFIAITPGKVYTVSAWMMVQSLDSAVSTNFRCGFCALNAAGEATYFPAETRRGLEPAEARFTQAGNWKRLAIAARAPEGATHIGMDIDLVGKGVAWIDDVTVTEGYDLAAFGGKRPAPTIFLKVGPDLDPESAEAPLSVTFEVGCPLISREVTLDCEVVDYWFRPSTLTTTLRLEADEVRAATIEFDAATRARLFNMRNEAGANQFRVIGRLRADGEPVRTVSEIYHFANRVKKYGTLPAMEPRMERIDDIFGEQKLVDVIHCFDPNDPHPYIEGGRGMGAKGSGAVPNEEWKDIYRESLVDFTSIETILGRQFRVAHDWGWFGYKFNRQGLKPNTPYVVVLEYPEDTGRTFTVSNTGISTSLVGGYGFHTGKTLGDHWTRTLNSEYVDYPLSGKVERWYSAFYLGEKTWAPGTPLSGSATRANSEDGFWFFVGSVGPSQDPLASGAAVHAIKLYEIADMTALFPRIDGPPLELGRRELFLTAESDGLGKFPTDEQARATWARTRLYDACFMGLSGISPNGKTELLPLLEANRKERLGMKVFPRWMIEREVFGRIGVPAEALAKGPDGEGQFKQTSVSLPHLPDILHPATLRDVSRLLTEELATRLDYQEFFGLMLFKHYGASIPVSFSDYALALYERETGTRIRGADSASRRQGLLEEQKEEYYHWWYMKKRAFLLAIRDHLQRLRPDLKLLYFPWHSDDDYPFACGRLRYSGKPLMDKIYVPGTNILLVPRFTVPPEHWTEEEKRYPQLARRYYREAIAPELEGKVTLEDVLYGRYKDMPEYWDAPRGGSLPHLVYPHEMDLVKMLAEPGGIYANGVGYNPRLFREDKGFIYWAPVRHRFTADNPALLDWFRTGEGSAVAVHMPYNEETGHQNAPSLFGAHGVEHGGPFSMMEEVLAMGRGDPMYIMTSMWEPLKRGFPQYARAFAQAYRALPAVPSTVLTDAVAPADGAVVVRSYETDYGHYLAVINRAFEADSRHAAVSFLPAVSTPDRVINLGTGETVPFEREADGRITIRLTLPPMSLTSVRVVDAAPRVAFRDICIDPPVFSPNGDGRQDTVTLTGRTVMQVTEGRWEAAVHNAEDQVVRRFAGDIPAVAFAWDGTDADGQRCPDGVYEVRLATTAFPSLNLGRQLVVDASTPRARVALPADEVKVSVNNVILEGTLSHSRPGDRLFLRQKGLDDRMVAVAADNTFSARIEALDLGVNTLSFFVRNRAGNTTPAHECRVHFVFDPAQPIGFDFGAGPIMDGFSAIRNDTFHSEQRGYGWIRYENVWKGDRGIGDFLVRDYCSGKEDREFTVKLPNGRYTVKVVMVDTQFNHYAPDIYLQEVKLSENRSIKANDPLWVTMETEVTNGVLNCQFKNPGGRLPFFALNGIVIQRQ